MDEIFYLGQRVLLGEIDPDHGLMELLELLKGADLTLRSQSSSLIRLLSGLSRMDSEGTTAIDLAVHLRQYIFAFKRNVEMSQSWIQRLQPAASQCGIEFYSGTASVSNDIPEWFEHPDRLNDSYNLVPRRRENQVIGDGILHAMTGYTHYQSAFQKHLVQASLNMQPGDTLIASLPTGGGKSLIGIMPAFFNTQGGELSGGTVETSGLTIVVVPTVALALDQKKSAREYFDGPVDESNRPQAYRGGMPEDERQLILQSVEKGTLPVLYTNPESLMHGQLADVIMASASRGHVTRLVIDEAHIIVDWGNHFRPDFQFLASFREKLLRLSKGKLRTVLMSATLTEWSVGVLRELFGDEGKITEIRCDALRPEPTYFVSQHRDSQTRYKRVTEMLGYLPRPAILYVNTKADAVQWKKQFHDYGYRSVEVFTGEATDNKRKTLLDQWNNDEIDIMVATTAFGMGVDKPDVRTIIHACLPESFNRYYQEVGRGGRDGLASIGWLNYTSEDTRVVRGITSKSTISVEILVERWETMYAKLEQTERSDEFWIDLSLQPPRLQHTVSGDTNQGWNASIVLLMQRHGILDVLEVNSDYSGLTPRRKVRIKINEFYVVGDSALLFERVKPDRDQERQRVSQQLSEMQHYAESPVKNCIADYLTATYRYSASVCGGCPSCYQNKIMQTYNDIRAVIPSYSMTEGVPPSLASNIASYLIGYRELILEIDDDAWFQQQGAETLEALIRANIPLLILSGDDPPPREWMHKLPSEKRGRIYMMLEPLEWSQPYAVNANGRVAAILYSKENEVANRQYVWSRRYLETNLENCVIHIVNPAIFIPYEGKALEHVLDAHMITLQSFLSQQKARTQYSMI